MIAAVSFAPVTVTSIALVAVPSRLVTVSVSCTIWPLVSACVAALVLSSAYVQAPVAAFDRVVANPSAL